MDHDDCIRDHSETLATLSAKMDVLTQVFSLTKDLHLTLVGMAGDSKAILLRLEQQGDTLVTLVGTLKEHEARFDRIEDQMGTKDTIIRIHERVDELEKKDGKNAEKLLGQIKWLLISLLIGGVFAIVWGIITKGTP